MPPADPPYPADQPPPAPQAAHQQSYRPIHFGARILILAAHPDDEVAGFAAAIARAHNQGAKIFTLYCTDGCIAADTLWPWQRLHHPAAVATRRAEAEQAADFLRITPAGWAARPARHLWRDLPAVAAEAAQIIAARRIDQLWVPAYEGGNADHDALNAVGAYFALQNNALPLAGRVREGNHPLSPAAGDKNQAPAPLIAQEIEDQKLPFTLEFAEYNYTGGKTCAQQFPYPNGTERTLFLTGEEQAMKRQALKLYASEQQNLNYVGTGQECFRPIAAYDYAQPPHPGILWYARHQWVPFRHPRVDFTDPKDVSAAITQFLAAPAGQTGKTG